MDAMGQLEPGEVNQKKDEEPLSVGTHGTGGSSIGLVSHRPRFFTKPRVKHRKTRKNLFQ